MGDGGSGKRWRSWLAAGAMAMGLVAAACTGADARSGGGTLFNALAGSWAGGGSAGLIGHAAQSLQCRATFTAATPSAIHMALRCASGSFAIQVAGDIVQQGSSLSGSWTETSTGVSGNMSGSAGPGRLRGVIAALGQSAVLSIAMHGDVQSVTLASRGLSARAVVTLRRA